MCLQKIHKIQRHLCIKRTAFTNGNISKGYAKVWKFKRVAGVHFRGNFYKIQRERRHWVNPFHGGGMDIFWHYTILLYLPQPAGKGPRGSASAGAPAVC